MMAKLLYSFMLVILSATLAAGHAVEYNVQPKGISVRFFFLPDEPASYSAYEIFGPGDKIPHQKGRSDRNGVVSFLPDRPGAWTVKVVAESEHGGHAASPVIQVSESLLVESFSKPLVAAHSKFFVGAGVLLGALGLWALWTARRTARKREA